MTESPFDLNAWLRRIGLAGPLVPTLDTLRRVITAQSAAIPFESVGVLLGRVPQLDLPSLQARLVAGGRGGYCFELNALLRAGLKALGFEVVSCIGRVIRGMEPDAAGRPATHMLLRVELPEGSFLADVGFGNLTPTAPLLIAPNIEQATPHETMRLLPVGHELTLQAHIREEWQSIYRFSPNPVDDIDYAVGNWYTATHPASLFVCNMIVARPGAEGLRCSLFNGRLTIRRAGQLVEQAMLADVAEHAATLRDRLGLALPEAELTQALAELGRRGTVGTTSPFFS